jgi:hypothetical protein
MSNALSEEKKQQVIALGKLGWSLRKIERETGVRRETAGAYLRGGWDCHTDPARLGKTGAGKTGQRSDPRPAKPANEVTPDFVGRF